MSAEVDRAVEVWSLAEFRKKDFAKYDHVRRHLQLCVATRVVKCGHQVECLCYSEWTRDDVWQVVLRLDCGCGVETEWVFEPFGWNRLPEMIEEIRQTALDLAECEYSEG